MYVSCMREGRKMHPPCLKDATMLIAGGGGCRGRGFIELNMLSVL